jgi:hypothetical protein
MNPEAQNVDRCPQETPTLWISPFCNLISGRRLHWFLPVLVVGIYVCWLRADTWQLPRTTRTESSNKTYRFTTTPGRRMVEPMPEDVLARLRIIAESPEMSGEDRKQWKERIGSIEEINKRLKKIPDSNGRLERKRKSGAY